MIEPSSLQQLFEQKWGISSVTEAYFSPGRINLIGEHIDYNGGYVMPAAISMGITALFQPDQTSILKIYSVDFNETLEIDFTALKLPDSKNRWALYVVGTLKVLQRNNRSLRGGYLLMNSDLPLASGLSSSAAIECLMAFVMDPEYYAQHRKELALHAQMAEREEVGVNCGIMDQFAIANGRHGQAMLLDCATLDVEYLPANFDIYSLVIINSNHPRTLADSKYNERRQECDNALAILQRNDPAQYLVDVHEISVAQLEDDLLYARAKHVVTEQKRVLAALEALKSGDIAYFGRLLFASHQSLDQDYDVAGDALNALVEYAGRFSGCIGARMTGAGFGGCVIALVEQDKVKRFCDYVGHKYHISTGLKADFFQAEIVDGVKRL